MINFNFSKSKDMFAKSVATVVRGLPVFGCLYVAYYLILAFAARLGVAMFGQSPNMYVFGSLAVVQAFVNIFSFTFCMCGALGACYYLRNDVVIQWGNIFSRVKNDIVGLVFAQLMYLILVLMGFFLLIVPGFIFGVRYLLAIPAKYFLGVSIREAFEISENLTKGNMLSMTLWFSAPLVVIAGLEFSLPFLNLPSLADSFATHFLNFVFITFWSVVSFGYFTELYGDQNHFPDLSDD